MRSIQEWLGEQNTAVNYLVEGYIKWDIVPTDELNELVKWTLTGEDSSERLLDMLFTYADGGESSDLFHTLIGNQAYDIYDACKVLREITVGYVKYICDMEIDIAEDAARIYGREYARQAAEDSRIYAYDAENSLPNQGYSNEDDRC